MTLQSLTRSSTHLLRALCYFIPHTLVLEEEGVEKHVQKASLREADDQVCSVDQ